MFNARRYVFKKFQGFPSDPISQKAQQRIFSISADGYLPGNDL